MKLCHFIQRTVISLGVVGIIMPGSAALRFDGANDYVTFGVAPGLGATNFTIECWFKRQGAGAATTTGTGGINVLPLVTKGRGENEAGVTNMNYFLGLGTNDLLAADFEDKNNGLNHPISAAGNAAVSNAWQHVAVTYNVTGSNWVLYLGGVPISTNIVSGDILVRSPENGSIQHAALASALTTAGTAAGFFGGSLEEVRIWNYARSAAQIAANKDQRISSASGLIGRWPLTETSGTTAGDTSGSGINGTLMNGPVWTNDSSFAPPATGGIIGNTNEGTLTDPIWSGGAWINAARFQAASNMTVSTMHAKVTAVTGRYKCAIYTDSSSLPSRLLRSTTEVTNPATGWQTFPLTTPPALTNGNYYWLAIWSDASTAALYYSDTNGTLRWGQYNYGAWPDPVATTGGSTANYCIYAMGASSPTLASIAVTPSNPTLQVGTSQQFTATGTYSDSSTQNLTSQVNWTSSNPAAATISASGLATAVAAGTTTISATLSNVTGNTLLTVQPALPAGTNVLISFSNSWRYMQTSNLDGTTWKQPSYNDSAWPSGQGVLALEDCNCLPQPIRTTLTLFTNRLTHYFRTHFNFSGSTNGLSLVTSNLIDNGGVLYLNGAEIARIRMPSGTITDSTPASEGVGNATNYDIVTVTGSLLANLVQGDNLLAAEVHQADYDSTDVVFGSSLAAVSGSAPSGSGGLRFDGVDDMVTFGVAPSLGVTNFTIECWFKRQGAGKRANTGTSGVYAYPLVTKGQGENENGATNMNYFFGIGTNDAGQAVLAADFEDFNNGLNHPVRGSGLVASNEWQHGAVTYDVGSSNWVLYLNGVPDVTNTVTGPSGITNVLMLIPRYDSLQHAALGAALRTGGTTNVDSGFFAGTLDEARIWNYARTAQQIAEDYNRQITSAAGLIARWSLDDASGTTATNSIAGGVNGTLLNGPVWAEGYPFPPGPVNQPPAAPASNSPTNGASGVITSPTLSVSVSDPETNSLLVTFYGRVASGGATGEDFTLVVLPDTQNYSASLNGGSPAIFISQTEWIVTNRAARNVAYAVNIGDIVNDGDNGGNDVQWQNATNAMYRLENPARTGLPTGIPYGLVVGNHDQTPIYDANGTTTFYNQNFGTSHFQSYSYYGGHYGTNNDNHYDLFSAAGMDFIVIHLEYDETMSTASPVLAWANSVLATNQNRRAIVASHYIIGSGFNAAFSAQGQAIYDGLKANTNLFLMLCGHTTTEGQRTNVYQGRTVWSVLTDYQGRANGGNGWLRLYEFSPSNNVIRARTYSPWLNQWETDADSQFDIPYAMGPVNPFTAIATNSGVASGATASTVWSSLLANTTYEWYVTVSDGTTTTTGPVWQFTTGTTGANTPPVANSQSLTNAEDAPLAITLSGYDPEGSNLTYTVVSGPMHGAISGTAPNLLFTPTTNYYGADSLGFVVSDGALTSAVATVSITITPVNDAPIASSAILQVNADSASGIVLPAADPDGDPLTFTINVLPTHGLLYSFNPTNGAVTYLPAHGYTGNDTVSFTATDGVLTSGTGVVTLAVQPLADGNGNGLPDAWELTYVVWDPNADPDHDGLTNLQEYQANTNPTNAASVLRFTSIVVATNRYATLSWQAVGGTRYRLSYSNGGSGGGLPGVFIPIVRPVELEMAPAPVGTPMILNFTDDFTLTGGPPTGRARYYRVSIMP
jgi:hypothetical protein